MSAQLKPLNRKTAADQIPRETAVLAERVVQFGEGNFLRAFADWMIDRANRNGPATAVGRVVAVQPISHGMADIINSQDGLYHVCQRGVLNGVTIDRADLVASVSRCLDPYANYCGLLQLARSPDVSIVISNTTEAGIAYVEEHQPVGCDAKCPASYPAKVAAYLYARFKAFAGSHESGMLFLPCELIEANGSKLLDCVLKHAAAWGLPAEFVAWVKNDCVFCNTLVDRIVPGYPKEEAPMWLSRLGFDDKILVATEPFALWVIETQQNPQELAARFHFEVDKVPGMNIIWTTDLRPHRTRKVKVLNGSHTSIVAASYLAGVDTVRESIEDPVVGKYLTKLLHGEILPGLTTPAAESRAYADAVWERFANPFIRHLLLSISLNSVSKWTVRVLPSVKDALAQKRHPRLLIHSLAALLAFYNGKPTASDAELQGVRFDGVAYPIKDNSPILATMAALWKQYEADKDVAALVKKAMSDKSLWNEDLTALGFVDDVVASLTSILKNGSRKAMEELIA